MVQTRTATAFNESDEELVERARLREADAFGALLQRYNRRLFRMARSIVKDDSEAEDVVQETYLKAFSNLHSFKGESRFGTWLTRIAINEALGRARKQQRNRQVFDESPEIESCVIPFPLQAHSPNPERSAMQSEVKRLLEEAIDTLPATFRTVFIARDVEGLSIEETADLLELKPETVKTRLHRARKHLRDVLDKEMADALGGAFSFEGQRCARLAAGVMLKLGF